MSDKTEWQRNYVGLKAGLSDINLSEINQTWKDYGPVQGKTFKNYHTLNMQL